MGINLLPYLLGEVSETEFGEKFLEVTCVEQFDSLRYKGDSDFYYSEGFEWIYEGQDLGDLYKRPRSPKEAMDWVRANIQPELQQRLLLLLEKMAINPRLFLRAD